MWKVSFETLERLLHTHSINEIARKTGYSRQTIYGWKNENYLPSMFAILKICNSLNLNPATFFDYKCSNDNKPLKNNKEIVPLDVGVRYYFEIKEHIFSLVPMDEQLILMCTYDLDNETYGGFKVREKIKIKVKALE